ncbi:MAG: tetratricopeptide repeat protein [Candidatus Omnitrophica bacterium]|nr:tetratricopeptide repeat protein [Candidatus Omnitrophota bacterium]
MKRIIEWSFSLLVFGVALWFVGKLAYRTLERSADPARLAFKWIISVLLFGFAVKVITPIALENPFIGIPFLAIIGLIVGIIWAPSIAAIIAKSVTIAIDGGLVEPEARPFLSVAQAKRKRGQYREAIAEVERELARFPNDFPTQMLLAEIQAEDLKDLPTARDTLNRILQQEGHAQKNIAYTLNRLADWELKIGQNPDAARQALEQVQQRFPDSEPAYLASQRLAHIEPAPPEPVPVEPRAVPLKHYEEKLGLRDDFTGLKAPVEDLNAKADGYVKRLEQFPADNEAREALALLYADHFQRLDLATDQLEQLIAQPGAPSRLVAHWLNLLADLQIKCANDPAAARLTLERIIARDPKSGEAEKARKRVILLGLEMKGQQKGQVVRLGSYEQDLGLKQGWPKGPRG